MNKSLVDYIKCALLGGRSEKDITSSLLQKNWPEPEVSKAFNFIRTIKIPQIPSPPKKSDLNIEINIGALSASKLLLFIGGLIMVLAGIIFVSLNWQSWPPLMHVLAIFLPMLFADVGAFSLWKKNSSKSQALLFIITGALLLPLFLIILVNELTMFRGLDLWQTGFLISGLTFAAYLLQSAYFVSPVWTFMSGLTGITSYFFLIRILDLKNKFEGPIEAWAFFIPAGILTLITYLYGKSGLEDRFKIMMALSFLVTVIPTFYLLIFGFYDEPTGWLVFIPLVLYFLLALGFEIQGLKEASLAMYGISLMGFAMASARMGLTGNFMHVFFGTPKSDPAALGGSIVFTGILSLGVFYLLKLLKQTGSTAANFSGFFEILATTEILGGIFQLSLGGKKIFYESLLLFSSLGFIFGSILRQSRAFLYIGSLFLVIYIFDIGSEYFQNEVGWPITLFMAGIMSMAIGLTMEKIRKKYFNQTPV